MNEWRLPTPHEVLATLVAAAYVLLTVGVFPSGSHWEKLLEAIGLIGSLGGINAAARHIPPRVQKILNDRDELVSKALHGMNGKPE